MFEPCHLVCVLVPLDLNNAPASGAEEENFPLLDGTRRPQRLLRYTEMPLSRTRTVLAPEAVAAAATPIRLLPLAVVVTFLAVSSQ